MKIEFNRRVYTVKKKVLILGLVQNVLLRKVNVPHLQEDVF